MADGTSGAVAADPAVAVGALLDRVLDLEHLRRAWRRVRENQGKAGGDGVTLGRFAHLLDANLLALADEVRVGTYQPGRHRRVHIQTGTKRRMITILPVRDRVLQRAALEILTPLLDRQFLPGSFGYRPGRGVQDAVERIVHLRNRGLTWVVDADIRDCFPSLDHALLAGFLGRMLPPGEVALLRLLGAWFGPALPARPTARPARGIALGAPISPLLCNVYLHQLDQALRRRRLQSVRYADDFVVLCKSAFQAEWAMRATEKVLRGLELTLHPGKTRLVHFEQGFDFLGVRFEGTDYHYDVDGKHITVDELPPDWFHYHADGYV